MNNSVLFRDFEERDIDFIFKCKNDESLNRLIVGQFKPFTHEDAEAWVKGVIRADRKDMRFWAICTNDKEKRIIGWASLASINHINQSALGNGIVIADPAYHDGIAFLETYLFMFKYVFETLCFNRFYGYSLVGNKSSNLMANLMLMKTEGILRQAVYKNGKFYDLQYDGILKDEYFKYKEAGEFEIKAILRRLKKSNKHE